MTKAIIEMDMEELAAHAVTVAGWDWTLCGGMFVSGAGRVPDEDVEKLLQMTPEEFEEFKRDVVSSGFRPDLEDNATLGCVLAMVRKRHGKYVTTMHRPQGWNVVDYRRLETVHIVESFDTWGFMPILAGEFKTEAHALIAALVKEVQS